MYHLVLHVLYALLYLIMIYHQIEP